MLVVFIDGGPCRANGTIDHAAADTQSASPELFPTMATVTAINVPMLDIHDYITICHILVCGECLRC